MIQACGGYRVQIMGGPYKELISENTVQKIAFKNLNE
jgi:hypothetical protein